MWGRVCGWDWQSAVEDGWGEAPVPHSATALAGGRQRSCAAAGRPPSLNRMARFATGWVAEVEAQTDEAREVLSHGVSC